MASWLHDTGVVWQPDQLSHRRSSSQIKSAWYLAHQTNGLNRIIHAVHFLNIICWLCLWADWPFGSHTMKNREVCRCWGPPVISAPLSPSWQMSGPTSCRYISRIAGNCFNSSVWHDCSQLQCNGQSWSKRDILRFLNRERSHTQHRAQEQGDISADSSSLLSSSLFLNASESTLRKSEPRANLWPWIACNN